MGLITEVERPTRMRFRVFSYFR